MTGDLLGTMIAALADLPLGVAIFDHHASGVQRRSANPAWSALGGAALDATVIASGFVEGPRLIESRLPRDGREVELRLAGAREHGIETTLAVVSPVLPVQPGIGRVAHDLSNPLTYVLIHLRRLRETVPQLVPEDERPKITQLLDEALGGAERLASILREAVLRSRG